MTTTYVQLDEVTSVQAAGLVCMGVPGARFPVVGAE